MGGSSDENRTLDRLVKRNELNLEIIAKLAGVVAASHRRAPIIGGANAGQALQRQIEETLISLEAAPRIFAAQAVAGLRHAMQQAFARLAPLLSERENQGQVRRCHGDLHLRNIVLIEDRPVLFDAIEFDEAIATCDVLYDLAFLLMDLWTRGLRSHANLLFNRYLRICDDVEGQLKGLSLLPLFLSLRAAIRAKVTILQPGSGDDHAIKARPGRCSVVTGQASNRSGGLAARGHLESGRISRLARPCRKIGLIVDGPDRLARRRQQHRRGVR